MKRFLALLILCMAVPVLFLMSWNYMHDTFGILNPEFSTRHVAVAENFVKVRYILDNPEKYDAFIFGSSRVSLIDLSKAYDGYRWYNMTSPARTPEETYDSLKYFLRGGVTIKKIVVAIEGNSFRVDPEENAKHYDRIPYKPHDVETYLKFLLHRPEKPMPPDEIWEKGVYFDIYDTGLRLQSWREEKIDQDPKAHKNDPEFWHSMTGFSNKDKTEAALDALRKIKKLCDDNGIEFICFFHPVYVSTYVDENPEWLDAVKRQVALITPYYDFSGVNAVTTDPMNYLEASHYRKRIGDLICHRILENGEAAGDGFGAYVTTENVDRHLAQLHKQTAEFLAAHPCYLEHVHYYQQFAPYLPPEAGEHSDKKEMMFVHVDEPSGEVFRWDANQPLSLKGWYLLDCDEIKEITGILTMDDGQTCYYIHGKMTERPDVVQLVHLEKNMKPGFLIQTMKHTLPSGRYKFTLQAHTVDGRTFVSKPLMIIEVP